MADFTKDPKARQDAAKKKFYGGEYKPDIYKKPVTLASEKARRSKASPLEMMAAPPDTRTEGTRMGEFDLDRIESGGAGFPDFAVMVDDEGNEHPIELEEWQDRPTEGQIADLSLKLEMARASERKGEAFQGRVLERKQRHTEETGSLGG